MNPPFTRCGTTMMHFELSTTSSGTPLSGADNKACNTSADFWSRSVDSSLSDAHDIVVANSSTAAAAKAFFIVFSYGIRSIVSFDEALCFEAAQQKMHAIRYGPLTKNIQPSLSL
jgi:hypothetical protein